MSQKKLILCPYCGNTQTDPEERCTACCGFFDNLSLRVTQQAMGPWFIRDRNRPFRPGCTYDVILKMIDKGKIKPTTIMRGPTTRQFWSIARNVPGIAHRLGYCPKCGEHVDTSIETCPKCSEVFISPAVRDKLGLAPIDPHLDEEVAKAHAGVTGLSGSGAPSGDIGNMGGNRDNAGSGLLSDLRIPDEGFVLPDDSSTPDSSVAQSNASGTEAVASNISGATQSSNYAPTPATQWVTDQAHAATDHFADDASVGYQSRTEKSSLTTTLLIAVNAILLLVVVAVVVWVLVSGIGDASPETNPNVSSNNQNDNNTANTGDNSQSANPSAGNNQSTSPIDPLPGDGVTSQPQPNGNTTNQQQSSQVNDIPPAPEPAVNPWKKLFHSALQAERIDEFDHALILLNQIDQQADAEQKPKDLAEAITRVKSKIEKRKAQDFFDMHVPESGEDNTDNTSNSKSDSPDSANNNSASSQPQNTGQPNIFNNDESVSESDRQKNNWASRFDEAISLEKKGEVDKAMKILQEIEKAPKNVQPEGFEEALKRFRQKVK